MNFFAFTFLALFGLCSAAHIRKISSLSIDQSMRQSIDSPFKSFESFNVREGPGLPPVNTECLGIPYRKFDGTCNNLRNIFWGARDQPFRLIARPVVFDISQLPNARHVSNVVCKEDAPVPNRRRMSELVTYFGQFIDHAVTETAVNDSRPWPIPIPANDPTFPPGGEIEFFRSVLTGTGSERAPRNFLSSYIDAANVYSSEEETARKLRTMADGKMKLDANRLLTKEGRFFVSGDARVNENPPLTSLHTLFTREHNMVAEEVRAAFPARNDEEIYQTARKIVDAEMQAVVFYEFLPAVIGRRLPSYPGYDEGEQASISNTFSTVGFRVGHTLINQVVTSIDASSNRKTRKLRNAFFNPEAFVEDGMDNLLRGMMRTQAAEIDNGITEEVRDFLVSSENRPDTQLDLAALNIQRGRDHGVPSYNELRVAYGLPRLQSFEQITSNELLQMKLEKAYNQDIEKVDPWVGGISEDHAVGSLGSLFARIWIREFTRLRNGDRFYFENNRFSAEEISKLPAVNGLVGNKNLIGKVMQFVIQRNTGISDAPANPFFV